MGNLIAKTSGEIATFMTPAKTNIKSLKIHFSPKQLGTGDPSPENVREIVGWDGVEAYNDPKYGGNIVWNQCFDLSTLKIGSGTSNNFNVTKLDTGFKVVTNTDISGSGSRVIYFTLKWNRIQNHRYIFLCKIKSDTLKFSSFYIYHANGSSNRPAQNSTGQYVMAETYTGTTSDSNSSLRLYIYGIELLEGESFEVTNLMAIDLDMMFGTSIVDANATTTTERINWFKSIITNGNYREYNEGEITTVSAVNNEPYTNLSINWASDIGIAYGGYIDLISGELIEEYSYLNLSNLNWNTTSQVNVFRSDDLINYYVSNITNFICNKYITTSRASTSITNMEDLNIKAHDVNDKYIYIKDTSYTDVTEFKSSLIDCNIVYLLAIPITHQLTPTQLQSFVGQNNFWSNADYVEVEYDLIETEDIQKCRKKIILNQPQLKTVSDKIVSFNTDMVAPMKNCKIYFKPIQSGNGDPSPTNVRDINGWTNIDGYVNGDKISVDWTSDAGTIYGGYLDLAKKEVVAEWEYNQLTSAQLESYECGYSSNVSYFNTSAVWIRNWNYKKIGAIISGGMDGLCNMFPISIHNKNIYASQYRIYFKVPNTITSLEDFKTNIQNAENNNNGLFIAYKLATPIHYSLSSLTSQQLLTLKSTNHIWSETNGQQIDVTYWTRKNLTPTPLTNYLENQTWTESAYISSSGKKTTNTVSASHFLTNQILLEAGTYVLSGFSYYVGTDNTNYRIHAYDSTGKWLRQITFQQIGNLSPVDISFTLDTDTYVNVSIAMDFDGVLAKIN